MSEASIAKCYGTIIDNNKCFIARTQYSGGDFKVYCPTQNLPSTGKNPLTVGNSYARLDSDSLRGVLDKLVESNYPIYEFEDVKTLFKWMIE